MKKMAHTNTKHRRKSNKGLFIMAAMILALIGMIALQINAFNLQTIKNAPALPLSIESDVPITPLLVPAQAGVSESEKTVSTESRDYSDTLLLLTAVIKTMSASVSRYAHSQA